MAAAALFLAAKVEEQPRKLEYVIRVANMCRNNRDTNIDVNSERYIAQSQDLVFNENVLLQTLGFDVAIDHPHTHVVRCCHLVRASKDLAQSSYFLASNSLHLTTMCLQYKPTVVACFCIHLACKWSSWEIPLSTEKKEWFLYVDPTVTAELLQQLTAEFLSIFESCPSRLKEKIMSIGDNGMHNCSSSITNSPFIRKNYLVLTRKNLTLIELTTTKQVSSDNDPHKHRSSRPHESSSSQQQREREYREKKEREKLAQQHGMKVPPPGAGKQGVSHGHHRPPVDPKLKQPHSRPPSSHPASRTEPRDILREAARDSPFGIATKDYNLSRDHNNKSDKDVQKQRDYLLKPNAAADTNSYGTSYNGEKPNRPPSSRTIDPNKVPVKHEQVRRHEEKTFVKPDSDVKRPHSVPGHDRNSAYLNKSMNSTSQKVKSPFTTDTSKSVLKPGSGQPPCPPVKQHHHNGNSGSNYTVPIKEEVQVKEEPQVKEEAPNPVKRPSLFSPEKSPPDIKSVIKTSPISAKQSESFSFPPLSPLESPTSNPAGKRARNYSTGSEPELRPVMKKIDQVEGFENLLRDSTIGINKLHQVPDIITPITDVVVKQEEPPISFSKEMKPPDIIPPLCSDNISTSQPLVNGIETNPMLISNLLKETPTVPHLPAVANSIQKQENQIEIKEKEHHHKSKKKNKEKHKHKDKDKSKEEKEKKKKHKDKDREKHKHKEKHETVEPAEPIKIKIQKDKIQQVPNPIKIKIPKDVIKTESSGGETAAPSGGLKIKIPREIINNCTTGDVEKSRKRERDRSSPGEGPPAKVSRSGAHKDSKQNGRHSYSKVSNYNKSNAPPPTNYHNMAPTMYQPPSMPQNMYYYPTHMGVVPAPTQPYIYPDGQMYNFYNGGYAYPADMYQQAPPLPPGGSNPPLPMDAPPVIPPPPPPE
ncbi:cyclin-T [Asbolus verrucosus]|uniref:Cyclin-T n=1 Tax=Asbolus verrucosus TaxID=1661398 RepID=A0A482VG54_ASBVE|nr:cyclin-T [Asbolus verrucosus]